MPDDKVIIHLMRETIEEAKKSKSEDQGVHPKVGAIVADQEGNILQRAHRGEVPGCHAEFLCLEKAKNAGQNLKDCLFFVTLEPCTARGPGKKSCSTRIIESGLKKVYLGILDPNPAICGRGETRLRSLDVDVERFPLNLIKEIQGINKDFFDLYKNVHLSEESLYVKMQINHIMRDYLIRKGVPLDDDLPVDMDMTAVDISRICETTCSIMGKKDIDIDELVQEVRAEAFDKKYADRTYEDDGRGLGDYWKNSVRSILAEMGAPDYQKRKTIVVGIGNGLEGKELYTNCEKLTAVDIGEEE